MDVFCNTLGGAGELVPELGPETINCKGWSYSVLLWSYSTQKGF